MRGRRSDGPAVVDPGRARAHRRALALRRQHAAARATLLPAPPVSGAPPPLIAFVGSTISRAEAGRLCPGLDLRPPARRDDLYRAREGGAWGFLLIDGVFMQDDAVSPREVVDVLDDGALVVGAASMGALRAADCWPAGARGIGLIY